MSVERGIQFIEQDHIPDRQPTVYVLAQTAEGALHAQEKIERKGGIRLTTAMRESIVAKVYDFKFKKSGEALDKLELRLSHRAMVATFGKSTLEALAKIGPPYAYSGHNEDGTKLNPERLAEWEGTKLAWRVGALGYQISLFVKDPLPLHIGYHGSGFFTVKDGLLAEDIIAWQGACTDWAKQKREMALKVNAVLNSVTTFASLERTWPDGARFWKHIPIDFPFRNQVPAVKVDELNSALGL